MKKLLAGITAACSVVILAFSACALSASNAILIDAVTGKTLFERNAAQRSLVASTTKMMTALLICEQCNVLDKIQIPAEAVGIEGSSMYLKQGEVLTIQELLYGLMLRSGNDAAVALAIYCGGTIEKFSQMMNDKAKNLGMKNTHFSNPNGLDSPNHYSTAQDLAILARYAMNNPIFFHTVSAKSVKIGNRYIRNHNKMLWLYPGADGVKTGYTKASGRILVSSAVRDGRRLICVTIRDSNDWKDHMDMLDAGFDCFSLQTICRAGQCLGVLSVEGGLYSSVELLAEQDISFPLSEAEHVDIYIPGPGFAYAPIAEGQHAGYANFLLEGNCIGRTRLVYGKTVEQAPEPPDGFWRKILKRKSIW